LGSSRKETQKANCRMLTLRPSLLRCVSSGYRHQPSLHLWPILFQSLLLLLRSSVAIAAKSARTHSTDIERAEREERKAKHDERVRLQTERAKEKGKARAKEGGGMSEEDDGEDEDEDKEVKPPVMKKKKPSPSAAPATASKPKRETPTDFAPIQSSSAPRRLNDIAMAPPTLTLPRFASKAIKANAVGKPSGEGMADKLGLSLAQARILEEERERVILRYREIKERRGIKAEMGME
jgi:hypothetical protein